MSIEQKRAAVRAIIRKVVWDGANAHVVLFGADENEIEYPKMDLAADACEFDVDSETSWGEDSK